MSVVKLNHNHTESVKNLFNHKRYMGVDDPNSFYSTENGFNRLTYDMFCANYLSDLNNFHAYGYIDNNNTVRSLISFYESVDEPAWYYTMYRSSGNNELLRPVLDQVIQYNESHGRLKFYTLVHKRHSKLLRRFHWSKYNNERYGYFDEYLVPERCKCYYTNAWELLYKRLLLPEDSVVRCNYLKQEYRIELPIGGNI